ncbi:MAG: DMT family transporter [Bacteroidota bacterium]
MEKVPAAQQFKLHIIVFILGFTAILGKLIHIPAIQLVWYRTFIACCALFIILLAGKVKLRLPIVDLAKLAGIGLIVATHWICFFHAIKVSNVSVTLGILSTTTLFTSFLEPLISKKKISLIEVFIGLLIIAGIYIIFRFETRYVAGIIFSLLAAFFASLFSVLNKSIALKYDTNNTAFWEMLAGFAGITIFMFASGEMEVAKLTLSLSDILFLLILGVVCTAFAFAATIRLMQKLSAYYIVLAINLEPIYGILLAWFIFGESEHMTAGFYTGAAIILLSVFFYPILKRRITRANNVN